MAPVGPRSGEAIFASVERVVISNPLLCFTMYLFPDEILENARWNARFPLFPTDLNLIDPAGCNMPFSFSSFLINLDRWSCDLWLTFSNLFALTYGPVVQNAELFTLTYGAIVRQLLTDLEEVEEVNKQLDQMYNWEPLLKFYIWFSVVRFLSFFFFFLFFFVLKKSLFSLLLWHFPDWYKKQVLHILLPFAFILLIRIIFPLEVIVLQIIIHLSTVFRFDDGKTYIYLFEFDYSVCFQGL